MPKILLAEANPILRDTYSSYLTRHHYQVETAGDGLDCLSKLRKTQPDCLILDLEMPWGGGEGVLGILNEFPELRPAQILLTSREQSPRLHLRFTETRYITLCKPFPLCDLVLAAAKACESTSKRSGKNSSPGGILVVDDEPAIRELLSSFLELLGYPVWTCPSGESALNFFSEHGDRVALTLLDIQMPGLDGAQTLQGLRSYNPRLPACFMTGNLLAYETLTTTVPEVRHVFFKPFSFDEMTLVIMNLIGSPRRELQIA